MRFVIGGVLLLATLPMPVRADPLVIIGGTFTTGNLFPPATFTFITADGAVFDVDWRAGGFIAAAVCNPCPTGATINPGARYILSGEPGFFGQSELSATGSATGVAFAGEPNPLMRWVTFTGDLGFTGPAVELPAIAPSEFDSITVEMPFSFAGVLNGYDIFRRDTLLLFSSELTGSGTARLRFSGSPFGGFTYRETEYQFVDPVPEPGTLTLVGSVGLLIAGARRRWARPRVH
jgi:hypothetical protein